MTFWTVHNISVIFLRIELPLFSCRPRIPAFFQHIPLQLSFRQEGADKQNIILLFHLILVKTIEQNKESPEHIICNACKIIYNFFSSSM